MSSAEFLIQDAFDLDYAVIRLRREIQAYKRVIGQTSGTNANALAKKKSAENQLQAMPEKVAHLLVEAKELKDFIEFDLEACKKDLRRHGPTYLLKDITEIDIRNDTEALRLTTKAIRLLTAVDLHTSAECR